MWTTCGKAVKNYVDSLLTNKINNFLFRSTKKFSQPLPHVIFMISTAFLKRVRLENTGTRVLFHSIPSPTTEKTEIFYICIYIEARERSYTQK